MSRAYRFFSESDPPQRTWPLELCVPQLPHFSGSVELALLRMAFFLCEAVASYALSAAANSFFAVCTVVAAARGLGAAAAHTCCRSGYLVSNDHNFFLAGLALSFFLSRRRTLSTNFWLRRLGLSDSVRLRRCYCGRCLTTCLTAFRPYTRTCNPEPLKSRTCVPAASPP